MATMWATNTDPISKEGFLDEELPRLSEEETDLALSSMFTPKLPDQAIFAELLGRGSVDPTEWPGWIERLHTLPAADGLGFYLALAGNGARKP